MIYSTRDVFVGSHLTPKVKDALRAEVAKEGTTMSWWVFCLIVSALQAKGHDVTTEV